MLQVICFVGCMCSLPMFIYPGLFVGVYLSGLAYLGLFIGV